MRYKAIIAYDGTNYKGYQRQVTKDTIEYQINKAFRLMTRLDIESYAASRTDKGVHAKHQVIHFDTDIDLNPEQWVKALNERLPGDIRFLKISKAKDRFHARHSAQSKIYHYVISKKPLTAFEANYKIYRPHFNIDLVKDQLKVIEGIHDFSAFSPNKEGKDPVKIIYSFTVKETRNDYVFIIHGKSFLRYMVRRIMGNVISIGNGKKPIDHLSVLLETKDRNLTGTTAPACGLYLEKIYYTKRR